MKDIFIHETAEVSGSAVIGSGTKIWNQAQVRNDAVLGENCVVSKNVYIDEHVKIGNRVKVQNNVNVYHGVSIEDDVFLGPSMTFTNDMYPRSFNTEWEITETLVSYHRGVRHGRGWQCCYEKCAASRFGGGQPGGADWLGMQMRF